MPTSASASPTAENCIEYDLRSCPGCQKSQAAYSVAVASQPTAEQLPFDQLKPYWHGFFKQKVFFSYYRCSECGTLYCRQYFSPTQLDALYRQMPDNTAGVSQIALKKTQEGYFRVLKRYSNLEGNYLEVGPDIGLFTEHCVREGSFNHYSLFEPNREVRPALENVLNGKQFDIFPQFLDLNVLDDHSLSTAVMVHVLDHLVDPKTLLLGLKKKLARGAVLLFVTHDESSLLARLIKAKWPPYCLQHPLLFNPKTITKLLQSAGYRVLTIEKSANYYPVSYLAKHALWVAGLKNISLPACDSLALPFKLGNIITIAQFAE